MKPDSPSPCERSECLTERGLGGEVKGFTANPHNSKYTPHLPTLVVTLIAAVILLGCAPGAGSSATPTRLPPSPTAVLPTPIPDTAAPAPTPTDASDTTVTDISQQFDLGGFSLFISCTGGSPGAPTLLLEASAGAAGSDPETWGTLPEAFRDQARICVYDRAGLGHSDPSSTEPRTAAVMASELHALLEAAGEPGPYLLVAHSLGGLISRLYAYTYPEQVVGLILIDTTHEDFADFLQTVMAPDEFAAYQEAVLSGLELDMTLTRDEIAAVKASTDFPLGDLPLTVIARGINAPRPGLTDEELASRLVGWQDLQMSLASESTRGQFLIAEQSGHFIHLEQPQIVIDAVETMLASLKVSN